MKNAKNVSYLQIDHRIEKVLKAKGVEILPSPEAWEKYKWARKFFEKKPKEGFFIWVKKQVDFPISTCVQTSSEKVAQDLSNLIVIEKNIHAKAFMLCSSLAKNLSSYHGAKGKIIIRDNATLELTSVHKWDKSDEVNTDYRYFLGKNAKLFYNFKSVNPSGKFSSKVEAELSDYARAELKAAIDAKNSEIKTEETIILNGKGSSGIVGLRAVARKNGKIEAITKAVANKEGKAHLDCQGLIVDDSSNISLIPSLVVKNKQAVLTHEASIGRIADEQLNYLRSRGLTKKEAINLIINGFLKD